MKTELGQGRVFFFVVNLLNLNISLVKRVLLSGKPKVIPLKQLIVVLLSPMYSDSLLILFRILSKGR